MKISEMSTEQAAKCLCRIAEPAGRIGADERVAAYLKALGAMKGKPMIAVITDAMAKMVPLLLDAHYEDTAEILSAMTGKSREEIDAQNVLVTMRDVKDCADRDLIDFFTASSDSEGER